MNTFLLFLKRLIKILFCPIWLLLWILFWVINFISLPFLAAYTFLIYGPKGFDLPIKQIGPFNILLKYYYWLKEYWNE